MTLDEQATRAYYDAVMPETLCGCARCRLYRTRARSAFPVLARWLEARGIDMTKPLETVGGAPDALGEAEYAAVQYIVFGECPQSFFCTVQGIPVQRVRSHPDTGLDEPHFVLQVGPLRLRAR